MRAILIFDSDHNKKVNEQMSFDDNDILICYDKLSYFKNREKDITSKIEYIDITSSNSHQDKMMIVNSILDLISIPHQAQENDFCLPETTINILYDNYINIIYNLLSKTSELLGEKEIDEIVLVGGNPFIEFNSVLLSEGERSFRFFYKREWQFNYYLNNSFKNRYKITWNGKSNLYLLKIILFLKPMIIYSGKIVKISFKIFNRYINLRKQVKNHQKLILDEIKRDPNTVTILPVRNPIQVDPLVPTYDYIENYKHSLPLFLAFENYSNKNLDVYLDTKKVRYLDLYDEFNFSDLIKILLRIYNINKKIEKGNKTTNILDTTIDIRNITKELSTLWIDVLVFDKLLNSINKKIDNKATLLINNETYGHYAAIEGIWSKKNNVRSIGIQNVAMSEEFKPRNSWVDKMLLYSKGLTSKLSVLKPNECFVYGGPIAYDYYYNISKAGETLNKITIFTQPDDYKKDYFKIIEDVIEVIKEINENIILFVKLHPREKDSLAFKKLNVKYKNYKVIENNIDSIDLIANCDLVISIHSAVLMQSIIAGTPIVSVNYNNYDIKIDYVNHDVSKKVYSKQELFKVLGNYPSLKNNYIFNRKRFFDDHLEGYDGNSFSKILDDF